MKSKSVSQTTMLAISTLTILIAFIILPLFSRYHSSHMSLTISGAFLRKKKKTTNEERERRQSPNNMITSDVHVLSSIHKNRGL